MSVKGIHWAQDMRGVCPFRKALLYALGERHHKDQNIVVADQVMLAQDAGMSDRTVRKYLKLLKKDGLVDFRVVGRPGGSRITHYMLAFDRRRPLADVPIRKDVPDRNPEKRAALKRKDVPDRQPHQSGKGVPDQSGSCVPFPKDTKIHEEPHTPSGHDLVFGEIWKAFQTVHAANGNQSRVKGKAKTLKLFERKAKQAAPEIIRAAALAEVARQRANHGGKYLAGLIPWLNAEPWDTGEAEEAPDWALRLKGFREINNWRPEWGPKPDEPGYRGPSIKPQKQGALPL